MDPSPRSTSLAPGRRRGLFRLGLAATAACAVVVFAVCLVPLPAGILVAAVASLPSSLALVGIAGERPAEEPGEVGGPSPGVPPVGLVLALALLVVLQAVTLGGLLVLSAGANAGAGEAVPGRSLGWLLVGVWLLPLPLTTLAYAWTFRARRAGGGREARSR